MTIKPLGDRVVIKSVWKQKKRQRAALYCPVSAQEKPQMAEVVAVGPGGVVDGKEIKMEVEVGDKVLYSANMQVQK